MAAALGVAGVLELTGGNARNVRLELGYDNVAYEEVSEGQLRDAFLRDSCPELAPILDGKGPADGDRLLIVGEVYRAVRTVDYAVSATADAHAEMDATLAAAKKLGVQLQGKVEGGDNGAMKVILSTSSPLVVAVRPAFVPIADATLGAGSADTGSPKIAWQAFDPGDYEHGEVFDALMDHARKAVEDRRNALPQ